MINVFKKVFRNRVTLLIASAKFILDTVLYNIATIVSVIFRFDLTFNSNFIHIDDRFGIVENIIFIVFEIVFQLPLQSYEFASIKELSDIFVAVFLAKAVSYPILYLLREGANFSRGAYLVSFLIAFLFIAGVRLLYRSFYEFRNKKGATLLQRKKRVLIIGAGDAGEKILREITSRKELNYQVVGFVDDDRSKRMSRIHSIPVLGEIARLPHIVRMQNVEIAIFAMPSAPPEILQKVVSLLSSTDCEIRTLPALWEIVSGRISIEDVKNVELEDLLPRASIRLESTDVANYLKGKKVLITGAGGSIGSEISRQVASFKPAQVILLGRGENRIFDIERELTERKRYLRAIPIICDIRNRDKVFRIFEQYKPDVVFHAAAHKHVPLMEKNPDEAILNNVFGTKNLLDASIEFGVERFINISTDKAVNPINIMGGSKRIVELMVQFYARDTDKVKFASVRFGNVLGSRGSVAEVFKRQIKETGVITITDPDMERYFMLVPEAVQLVLKAGMMGERGEIFVLKMGEPVNILEFAKNFIKLSGKKVGKEVKIKVIGNRGNEKIKEELWSEKERIEKTSNPYILEIPSISTPTDGKKFLAKLSELESAAKKLDSEEIELLLKDIIPDYKI